MANDRLCPSCGTAMREIVWGYGTIADVADAGDVVIGGCVVDVDDVGRVAAMQCPSCGTRTDAAGVALEAPGPPAPAEHPFAVSFSSPPREQWEVTMERAGEPRPSAESSHASEDGAEASPYVDEDFGGIAPGGGWRDRVEPYASREDPLPPGSAPTPERVAPYASREDPLPAGGPVAPDRVEPYASRAHDLPPASAPSRDHVGPYSSREDPLPAGGGAWRERVEPYGAAPGGIPQGEAGPSDAAPGEAAPAPAGLPPIDDGADAVPGEVNDARWSFTSDFTDAEEEGWPPGNRDDD